MLAMVLMARDRCQSQGMLVAGPRPAPVLASQPPQPATQLPPLPSTILQIVQHVTGFNHYLVPPLFGFSLSMSVLMCEWREAGYWPLEPPAAKGRGSRRFPSGSIDCRSCSMLPLGGGVTPVRSSTTRLHPSTADLRDGPGGTKLIGKQVDYHSFESIL